jgi:hypothetical protein
MLLGLLATPVGASQPLRRLSARLQLRPPPDATGQIGLVSDPVRRRLVAFIAVPGGTLLRTYDLDRLRPDRERHIGEEVLMGLPIADPRGGRILVPFEDVNAATRLPEFGGILVLDSSTLATVATWPAPLGLPPAGMTASPAIWGIRLWTPPNAPAKLIWLYQDRLAQSAFARIVQNPVYVAQWDAQTGAHEWAYQVRGCRGEMTGGGWGLFRDQSILSMGCVTPEGTGLAVRLTLPESGPPTAEDVLTGPPLMNHVMADPAAGRLVFVSEKDFKESLLPFDVQRASFVGAIATTRFKPAGASYQIDPTTGRLFGVTSDKGIVLADIRRTPAQQALTFPEFARSGNAVIALEPAAGDRPRRAFVRMGSDDYVQIFEDRVAVSEDPPLSELDRFTVNHRERAGVTDTGYELSAHSYGSRVLMVAGVEGLASGDVRRDIRRAGTPCTAYDREIVAGFVPEARMSKGTAAAAAVAAEADPGTKVDALQPFSRCWLHPDPLDTGVGLLGDAWPGPGDIDSDGRIDAAIGQSWPFSRLECTGDNNPEPIRNETLTGFRADVACGGTAGRAEAFSQSRGDGASVQAGTLRVAESASHVTLERVAGGGVRARAEAWARGIEIAGVASIELVRTVATSGAAGLPGSAKGAFTREICGVVAGTFAQKGCGQSAEAVAAINRALGARGRVILRSPDLELAKGSPGGYLASVRKDRFEELSDRALNNDASTQVSGLEVLLINDDPSLGRARQVFQFAGVDASTSYGIFLLPTSLPPPVVPPVVPPVAPPMIHADPPPSPPPAGATTTVREIIRRVANGFAVAVRDPVEAALAALTWLTLVLPLYLARRRGSLGRALRRGRT